MISYFVLNLPALALCFNFVLVMFFFIYRVGLMLEYYFFKRREELFDMWL